MDIEAVSNRYSPPAILLSESYRQDGKVKKRTVANLSKWSPELVEGLRILLKKGTAVPDFESSFDIVRSQPYSLIAALFGSPRKIGLDHSLGPPGSKPDLVAALIVFANLRDRRPCRGRKRIALRVGKVVNKYKMAEHFELDITEESFTYERNAESIAAEAALDGLYVIPTSLPAVEMGAEATVRGYKGLSVVEQAFRSYKTVDLKARPIYHWSNYRVRAHVFLCLLAYYVEWHMRRRLAPLLFDDQDPAGAPRSSIVAPAEVSRVAQQKSRSKRTADGQPVHTFRTLLEGLATIVRNQVVPKIPGVLPFTIVTRPMPLQQQVLDRLEVRL